MEEQKENKNCFIIMPISDCDGYEKGHFCRVYEDIIKPAVNNTDFTPIRADEVKETNLIHLDILKKLIDAPIAICDLSTRNPNVLFELGIRQAFDKPVALIQEKGTPKIFDITPLRVLEYSKELKYHEVLKSQSELTDMINATKKAEKDKSSVNSIVKLLALSSPAAIPKLDNANKENMALDIINSQMNEMRNMLEMFIMERHNIKQADNGIMAFEYHRISSSLDKLERMAKLKGANHRMIHGEYYNLMKYAEEIMMNCDNAKDSRMIRLLINRIHRQMEVVEPM